MNFNLYKRQPNQYDVKYKNFKYRKFLKKLFLGNYKSLGRSKGQIVSWHRGGGVKRTYRCLWNFNNKKSAFGIIKSIEYNPSKSAFTGIVQFNDGSFSNMNMSSTNYINQVIKIYKKKSNYLLKDGDLLKLKNIPKGTPFHSLEAYPGSGPIYSRAAGVCSYLLGRENKLGEIKLSSKTSKFFDLECSAILGVSSNKYNSFNKKYKAGTNRLLNKRPIVRGVAMNPVDHPHGGGEGKGRPGRPSVSPWGKLTKGVPTKKNKKNKKK